MTNPALVALVEQKIVEWRHDAANPEMHIGISLTLKLCADELAAILASLPESYVGMSPAWSSPTSGVKIQESTLASLPQPEMGLKAIAADFKPLLFRLAMDAGEASGRLSHYNKDCADRLHAAAKAATLYVSQHGFTDGDLCPTPVASLPVQEEPPWAEKRLRMEWWLGHGCPHGGLYGDDGEMQCNNVKRHGYLDFKRDDLQKLLDVVESLRLQDVEAALASPPSPAVQEEPPAVVARIADAVQKRGRVAGSGEPLFFDRHNLERVIEAALASPGPAQESK